MHLYNTHIRTVPALVCITVRYRTWRKIGSLTLRHTFPAPARLGAPKTCKSWFELQIWNGRGLAADLSGNKELDRLGSGGEHHRQPIMGACGACVRSLGCDCTNKYYRCTGVPQHNSRNVVPHAYKNQKSFESLIDRRHDSESVLSLTLLSLILVLSQTS